jgi:membrane protein implicated in regulation of membrane protease activity
MIDLDGADLIADFATDTYSVTRRAAATYVDGIATPGATTTFSILAAVVPASGRDLLRLPEGRRSTETKTVYTASVLLVGAVGGNEADIVTIEGDSWEVQTAGQWPAATGFCVAIVQRAAEGQP